MSGQACVPPIVPIFERQTVPPCNYLAVSLAYFARFLNLYNYCWMSNKLMLLTFLT
jgi:hypothetical protein